MKSFYFFLSLIGFSLSALTVSAAEPTACTMEYAPVCGSVQVQCFAAPCYPVRETFSNSCMAAARGATNVTPWACESAPVKMSPRAALQSGTWHLESLNGKSLSGSTATLDFEKNRFHAKICNSMNGGYGVFRDRIIFRRVVSTMMYCEWDIMKVENAMAFAHARFMVGSDTLTITTRKGDVIIWKKQ